MQDRTMIYPCTPDYGNRFARMFAEFHAPKPDYRWHKAALLIAGIAIVTIGG